MGLRPANLQALPSEFDAVLKLLLNVAHQFSYPNMLKQVLFTFKSNLVTQHTKSLIGFCFFSTWTTWKWPEICLFSPYFCL